MPQTILLLPGVGAQGGSVADLDARVHERPGERARQRVALGQLRVPRERATTSARRQAPRRRGSSRRSGPPRAGSAPGDDWRRYAAPAAFLLAVTIAVVLIRSGLRAPARRRRPRRDRRLRSRCDDAGRRRRSPARTRSGAAILDRARGRHVRGDRDEDRCPASRRSSGSTRTSSSTSLFIGEKLRIE